MDYELKDFEALCDDPLATIRVGMGLECCDESQDARIKQMSPDDMFDRYLAGCGLRGFTADILQAINNIRDAFADNRAPDEWPFNSDYLW